MPLEIPFMTSTRSKIDTGFFDMIRNRICPNFAVASLSTACIGACLIIFIMTRIMYSPGGYSSFLQSPKEVQKFALNVELNHSDKAYYYQTVTSIFLHESYIHIVSNTIFAFFIMYELEHCWRLGIIVALVAGFAANSLALATMEGIMMGFSGVLCACVGVIIAALCLYCSYIRAAFGNNFYLAFFFCILMVILVIGMAQSALVHFFGLFFGLLFGFTLYPRSEEGNVNQNVDKLLKIFSIGFLVLAIALGLIV